MGDGEPVANHPLFQGRSSIPKIPDVYVRKAAVVLKYTYDEFLRMKFTKDSSDDEELEVDTPKDLLESFNA